MFFASSFLLLACNGSPSDALTWREQWEIIVITEDGGLIEGVASTGNTGMFRGEGQFQARRLFRKASPIIFEMDGGAADIDVSDAHDSVRIGSALVGRFEDGDHWTMRFAHEQANAIVRIDPGGPEPPMTTKMLDSGQWTVTTPISRGQTHGWFTAGRRGGMFEGTSIAFHRGGDGIPQTARETAVIMDSAVSIGIDRQGGQDLRWARIGDVDLPTDDLRLTLRTDGSGTLDFGPAVDLVIDLQPTGVGGESDALGHLLSPELQIAQMVGLRGERRLHRTRAKFSHDGTTYAVGGFTLQVD